ncbi:DUF2911 domain-containing protein [Aquimarina sp. 2-A2]|uniref:DUF2911 domain-containing protein n=1 Tax=Aquimarina sp. 2-A2 TaxID=3382644 RepID=UPI00387F01D0
MKKSLKIVGISSIVVILMLITTFFVLKNQTKQHSPEETVSYTVNQCTFTVNYNRPYTKGRRIFGGLVPFNQVWRTGANEPTTLTFDKDILVDGSKLSQGTYSIWTVPKPNSWKIIFNTKKYAWGVKFDGSVAHDPNYDALVIEVPSHRLPSAVEQFAIFFDTVNEFITLTLQWEYTSVVIPIKVLP